MEEQLFLTDDFTKYTENVYEAIMIIAKRARKIGADQKVEIERLLSTHEAQPEEEEPPVVEEKLEVRPELEMEKPTIIAFREFLGGDIEFDYKDKS